MDVADKNRVQILSCIRGTAAARIPRWRSLLRHKYVDRINGKEVHTCVDVATVFKHLRKDGWSNITLTLATDTRNLPPISQQGVPQIYFDQLNGIHSHLSNIVTDHCKDKHDPSVHILHDVLHQFDQPVSNPTLTPTLQRDQIHHIHDIIHDMPSPFPTETPVAPIQDSIQPHVAKTNQHKKKLLRKDLLNADDWDKWEQAEW